MLPVAQQDLLDTWLPGAAIVRDHSWGLVDRRVLEVEHGGDRFAVKAGGPDDGHMAREIRAHRGWLTPWTDAGRAPSMVHADEEARLLVTRWLPGDLVEGTAHADDPEVHRQAGELLALLHAQPGTLDPTYESRERDRAISWLDRTHRIDPTVETELRELIDGWDLDAPTHLVATHGDWQPRNWIVHDGVVSVIDLGRFDLRPAASDLTRLAAQDFGRRPDLEAAFLRGYGSEPREPAAWFRMRLREAISTAVWAFQVGDEEFERQGHRMIAEALRDR